ncbi:MAG TPA: GDSL-type esterase/lipase family protein [Gaiellaceae bacterium]|nr:GDSL-type esterase/lipase family protein [Gaiellaceae bacterium]
MRAAKAGDVPAARAPRSWGWREIVLALASLGVVYGAVEIVARRFGLGTNGYVVGDRTSCIRGSELFGHELVPRCTGVLYDTPLTTNGLGLRGDEVREDGSLRVLALGDSCTFGFRVRQDESYPAVLERLLTARSGRRWQVINSGVPGYTSHQGVVYLTTHGPGLAPAVVIAGFEFNDALRDGDIADALESRRRHGTFVQIDEFLLAHARLYRWFRVRPPPRLEDVEPPRVSIARYRENVGEIVARARAMGARVILIDWQLRPLAAYSEAMARVAVELDVPLVRYAGPYLDGWVHPTADGYALLAGELADLVADRPVSASLSRPDGSLAAGGTPPSHAPE